MKTILITGSTDGIGKLAAIKLAKERHHILLHGRNPEKLNHTIEEVRKASGNDQIDGCISDLSDFDSIQKMIEDLSGKVSKLDILINNAGVFKSNVPTNKDGLDLRFAVNYLAPYLLTHGLTALLKKGDAPRLINLSSAAQATVSIPALRGEASLSEQESYAQSKLALTMWSFHLSQKTDFMDVIAVNPGSLLNTRMVQEAYGRYWSSADKGAEILYQLAVSDQFKNSNGKYFDNDQGSFSDAHPDAYNGDKVSQLISETDKILKL